MLTFTSQIVENIQKYDYISSINKYCTNYFTETTKPVEDKKESTKTNGDTFEIDLNLSSKNILFKDIAKNLPEEL